LEFRRINESDCNQEFCTGEKIFDFDENGDPIQLPFYLDRDCSGNFLSYVLKENDKTVGVLCIKILEKNVIYLSRIGIQKKYRWKGWGYHLHIHMIEDIVEKNGIKAIVTKVHEAAFDWFVALGYLKIDEYDDPHWGKSAHMLLLIG